MSEKVIELNPIDSTRIVVSIEGDSDLVLNKMNDVVAEKLIKQRKDEAKKIEKQNVWREIITSVHWRDGKPKTFTEESYRDAMKNNAPCLTAFGFFKSFCDSVVRNGIDKYKTKFESNVNVYGKKGGLIPVTFADYYLDEKLMTPKKGSPVLSRLNRFTGWKAEFEVELLNGVYSAEQVLNIIQLAGFGLGIGSGRTSGYGRYHVTGATMV